MKNTIQIIGVCIANLALMVFTAIQIDQIREAMDVLQENHALTEAHVEIWSDIGGVLIAIPVVAAAGSLLQCFMAWKLYEVFAWDILKEIGADYRMKKRLLHYQVGYSFLYPMSFMHALTY